MAIITLIAAVVLIGLSLPDLVFAITHMNNDVWGYGVIIPGFVGALGATAYNHLPVLRKNIGHFLPRLDSFITETADDQRTSLWGSWIWTIAFSVLTPMLTVSLGGGYMYGLTLPLITIGGVLLGLLFICRLPLYWMAILVTLESLFVFVHVTSGYGTMMASRLTAGIGLGGCYLLWRLHHTHKVP